MRYRNEDDDDDERERHRNVIQVYDTQYTRCVLERFVNSNESRFILFIFLDETLIYL